MSKQLTKAQLVAQLEASHVAYQHLDDTCTALRVEVAQLRERSAVHVRPTNDAAKVAHDNYTRALLAARGMAMRTGKTVRVGWAL